MHKSKIVGATLLVAALFLLSSCSSEKNATTPQPEPIDTPPSIEGVPAADVMAGSTYEFQPSARDAEQSRLEFAISGKPAWASFDTESGRLRGVPAETHAGVHRGITISVSDGKHSTRLPEFAIKVTGRTRKAAYGHYFATRYADTPADAAMLCEQPGVRGVVWRETWAQVEPAPGVHDFSGFDDVLEAIADSQNPDCQLWLFVEWKSFANSPVKNPCPDYLRARYSGHNAGGGGAATCFMWEPVVVQAYVAMMRAAAARYDANPRVEGLILQESALGFNGAHGKGPSAGGTYSAEAWRDALVELVNQCGQAFAQSRCLAFLNFLHGNQQYLRDVSAALAAIPGNRGCISGPDLLPDETTLYENDASIYETITRHVGCRSNSIQNDSFEVKGCDLACIFRFGVGGRLGDFEQESPRASGLCVNSYLFWNHRVMPSATGLDWTHALPVIAANPYGPGWLERCAGGGGAP